jgi:hypothetical protein
MIAIVILSCAIVGVPERRRATSDDSRWSPSMLPSGDGKKRHSQTSTPLAWHILSGAAVLAGLWFLHKAQSQASNTAEQVQTLAAKFAEVDAELKEVLKSQRQLHDIFLKSQLPRQAGNDDDAIAELKTHITTSLAQHAQQVEDGLKQASGVPAAVVERCQQQQKAAVDAAVAAAVDAAVAAAAKDVVTQSTKENHEQLGQLFALQTSLQSTLTKQIEQLAERERTADARELERWGQVRMASTVHLSMQVLTTAPCSLFHRCRRSSTRSRRRASMRPPWPHERAAA